MTTIATDNRQPASAAWLPYLCINRSYFVNVSESVEDNALKLQRATL